MSLPHFVYVILDNICSKFGIIGYRISIGSLVLLSFFIPRLINPPQSSANPEYFSFKFP